jgi:hypothetical protein
MKSAKANRLISWTPDDLAVHFKAHFAESGNAKDDCFACIQSKKSDGLRRGKKVSAFRLWRHRPFKGAGWNNGLMPLSDANIMVPGRRVFLMTTQTPPRAIQFPPIRRCGVEK